MRKDHRDDENRRLDCRVAADVLVVDGEEVEVCVEDSAEEEVLDEDCSDGGVFEERYWM